MISPADFIGHPAKVRRLTVFFLKKKSIFVRLLCWLPAGQQHMVSGLRLLISINLKQIISSHYHWKNSGGLVLYLYNLNVSR